jgi:methylthioribose-1-phosphate isomerase
MKRQLETIHYDGKSNRITIIDQTRLPNHLDYKVLTSAEDVWQAINRLEVRGAPLIGITAAYGFAMCAFKLAAEKRDSFYSDLAALRQYLESARPTAVNLKNALDAMAADISADIEPSEVCTRLKSKACALHAQDRAIGAGIASAGAGLLRDGANVMTICNAGFLATANEYGTALAPVYKAQQEGRHVRVYSLETRPVLQGARLTTFELTSRGVQTTAITDSMAGWLMATHSIDAIFTGCDRVARNGDFANKIGTYGLAVLAKAHHIPFYVCLPSTTIDFDARDGQDITIEFRDAEEVRSMWYREPMVAKEAEILNPAFDCSPAELATGFITERGILLPPFDEDFFHEDPK